MRGRRGPHDAQVRVLCARQRPPPPPPDGPPPPRKLGCFARGTPPPPPYCCPYPCFYCTLKGGGLGNAAFHSAALYPALAPAIPPLVACLAEALDKTRSNAAGALGNLVRNDPPRTDRTRRVPHPVLIGHAASLTPY